MLNLKSINIDLKTVCDKNDKFDSITSWNNLILISNKNKHTILCYEKNSGKLVHTIGSKGFDYDKFNKPSGLKVINDYLFIVEKDNKRCQIVNMKNKEAISYFGFKNLKSPRGIDGLYYKGQYIIFITDEKLETVFKFNILINDDEINKISSEVFLELSGSKLESVLLDEMHNRLLLADEKKKKIRIFSLNGILIKKIENIFEGTPEDMVKTKNHYIFTDQVKDISLFHVYDIKNLNYMYTIYNNLVNNSNGLHFTDDYLYTIDNYCSIVRFNLKDEKMKMSNLLLIGGLLFAIARKFI